MVSARICGNCRYRDDHNAHSPREGALLRLSVDASVFHPLRTTITSYNRSYHYYEENYVLVEVIKFAVPLQTNPSCSPTLSVPQKRFLTH